MSKGLKKQDRITKEIYPELKYLAEKGQIERREFLRLSALLGVGLSASAGLGFAPSAMAAKRGGTLRYATPLQALKDPANLSWIEGSNIVRQVTEFLVEVDENNIARPFLATSWSPSEDLKTWRFKLREGVKWSNGDHFGADDVIFNFNRWTAKTSKSVNKTLFGDLEGVEKVNDHEIIIHLKNGMLELPENLYQYTTSIQHRSFDDTGADFAKSPIGTGPYQLHDFRVGEGALLKKRDGWWRGQPVSDEIKVLDLGTELQAYSAALISRQVDLVYQIDPNQMALLQRSPDVSLYDIETAQTMVLRMQVDHELFKDKRIRQAIQACADNQRILEIANKGRGQIAEHHHTSPKQPEYAKLPAMKQDIAKAKQLLAAAGKPNLEVEIAVGNTQGTEEQDVCQIFKQQCAEAGINLKINVMPTAKYWEIWDKAPFSLTYWTHRPLAVMLHNLAYKSGAVWNESHFSNAEYDKALSEASAIIDPKERSKKLAIMEKILQDEAVMIQPYWRKVFTASRKNVHGFKIHPTQYFRLDQVGTST